MRRNLNFLLAALGAAVLLTFPATAAETIHRNTHRFIQPYNEATLKVVTPAGNSSNVIEVTSGGVLKFAVPQSGVLATAYGGTGGTNSVSALRSLGVQAGLFTTAANGTFTNTFPAAFAVAPVVLVTAQAGGGTAFVTTVTTNGFVLANGPTNAVISWLAILPTTP